MSVTTVASRRATKPDDGLNGDYSWTRDPSWLALPSVTDTEQKFVGLHAVWPDSNFCALTVAGAYTVDWGDGTAPENVATGVTAYHMYDYADADLVGTNAPVTLTDSGDLITRTAHGYTNNMPVRLFDIVTTTGVVERQIYFVINATANTFQVSSTIGGSAVTLTTDGTANLLPYKQALVTVTMQGGSNLTSLSLNVIHNQSGLVTGTTYGTGWLDVIISGPNLTTLTISASAPAVLQSNMERMQVISSNSVTDMSNMFQGCRNLRHVLVNAVSATNMTNMFANCLGLKSLNLLNSGSVTNTSTMFSSCSTLVTVPLFNTASVTDMTSMFANCIGLRTVPLFNTASVTNMTSMFNSCTSLESVPHFNTASVTNMFNMFSTCFRLEAVPLFNTAAVTSMASMFSFAAALRSVPLFNTASVTNMSSMFSTCRTLRTVPLFNTAAVTTMTGMFQNCVGLRTVPLFNTTVVTDMSSMFSGCSSLQTVPLFNTAVVTNMNSMFNNCATLTSVPLFSTAAVTTMNSTFNGCISLQTIPLFNTAAVTSMASTFAVCHSLRSVPALNVSSVASANFSNTFQNCFSLSSIKMVGAVGSILFDRILLSKTALEEVFTNLGVGAGNSISLSTCYAAPTAVSLAGTTVAGSTTVTMANTTGIATGMQITGNGTPSTTAIAVAFTDSGDTVDLTAHGLSNGDEVAFPTITTTTGIVIHTIYYVVGATTNNFQVALTPGGSAIALTTNGTGTMRYRATVTAINPNVSVTLSRPATVSSTNTLAFRQLQTNIALLKGWSISG